MYYIAYLHGGRQVVESTKQSDPNVAARMLRDRLRTAGTPGHVTATERELVEWGVTPILRYDPLGRLVRMDLPDEADTQG